MTHLIPALREFWPRGGPKWDGLARVEGLPTVILVEAKNYPGEVRGGGCKARDVTLPTAKSPGGRPTKARARIIAALTAAAADLGVEDASHWAGPLYQYANRLAHVNFLRLHKVDARMVNVCFTGDPAESRCTSEAEWKTALTDLKNEIGFRGDTPSWLVDVILPAGDRSELVTKI